MKKKQSLSLALFHGFLFLFFLFILFSYFFFFPVMLSSWEKNLDSLKEFTPFFHADYYLTAYQEHLHEKYKFKLCDFVYFSSYTSDPSCYENPFHQFHSGKSFYYLFELPQEEIALGDVFLVNQTFFSESQPEDAETTSYYFSVLEKQPVVVFVKLWLPQTLSPGTYWLEITINLINPERKNHQQYPLILRTKVEII